MRRLRMNRFWASILSLFAPIPAILLWLLLLVVLPRLPQSVYTIGFFAFFISVLTMRVHFASWYAQDKGRDASLGFLAVFGIFGWMVLWSLEDRGFRFV